jgi:hypothetical protein
MRASRFGAGRRGWHLRTGLGILISWTLLELATQAQFSLLEGGDQAWWVLGVATVHGSRARVVSLALIGEPEQRARGAHVDLGLV